jgi:hypothetical protein
MALNGVEDDIGVKAFEQDERGAELNEGERRDEPAHMRQRQGLKHDIVIRQPPIPDQQIRRFSQCRRRMSDEFGLAGGPGSDDQYRGFVGTGRDRQVLVTGDVE